MSYTYVQKGYAYLGNTLTWQQATGAGNLLVVCTIKANNSGEYVESLKGNVNSSQSWVSAAGSINNISSKILTGSADANFAAATLLFLPGSANAGGDTTTTLTFAADGGGDTNLMAMEFSGIAGSSPFINYSINAQTAPGTGANAVTSGNVDVSGVPALLAGFFTSDYGTTGTPTGTGFSGRQVDTGSPAYMWGEDQRITTTGNVACTFTDSSGSGDHTVSIGIAFVEATSASTHTPPPNQFGWSAVAPLLPLAWTIERRMRLANYQQDKKSRLFLPSWAKKRP